MLYEPATELTAENITKYIVSKLPSKLKTMYVFLLSSYQTKTHIVANIL
jgi:hypothetical protein